MDRYPGRQHDGRGNGGETGIPANRGKSLAQFLERVARVNDDSYFLARATRVVLYGSMLRPCSERVSDVDLAVQFRVEQLAMLGRRFGGFLEEQFCWFLETFRFLKARSRVISLADYNVEKRLVLTVPHRMLLGEPEELLPEPPEVPQSAARKGRPRGCPF